MKPEAEQALRESIKHWEEMRDDYRMSSPHANTCNLCKMFIRGSARACLGCPVSEKTRMTGCVGTPFVMAQDAHYVLRISPNSMLEFKWKHAAQIEIDFLKSLLPENQTPPQPTQIQNGNDNTATNADTTTPAT